MDFAQFRRINIGCGFKPLAGYLNVDVDPTCNPDLLLADNSFSGVPRRHFDEVRAYDVLEHIPRGETVAALLEWASLLQPSGKLELETSDIEGIARLLMAQRSFERHHAYSTFMYGNQAHPGDWHHTGFTELTLQTYVLSAGFRIVSFEQRDEWLFRVSGELVHDWTALLDRDMSNEDFVFAATEAALFRAPQPDWWPVHLEAAKASRRTLLKQFYASHERALHVARRHSL